MSASGGNHRWKASGGTLLAGWSYDFDRIGNKKYQEDLQSPTQSELYGYDDVYRVTGFKRGQLNEQKTDITSPSRTQTWTLDPLGNWDETELDSVTETRTHNSINELTARTVGEDPEIDLSYDSAGNLTQDGDSNGDHKYTWDYRNRLIEVQEKQSGNWNTTAEYRYDAQNRRILKTVTNKGSLNGTTRFLWGGVADWQCLEERDGSGDLVARVTYAPGYIDAVAVQERDLNSDDDFGDANEVVYYHQNTLFTVYALSDGNESVIERYRYDAYGGCTVLDADGSADADGLSDVENPYTFTGRRLDPESALMQYRNRYYHTGLGRFISRDPLAYVEAFNMFAYARGGVSGRVDPSGLASLPGVWDRYPQAELQASGRQIESLPTNPVGGPVVLAVEWAHWQRPNCPPQANNCAHGEAVAVRGCGGCPKGSRQLQKRAGPDRPSGIFASPGLGLIAKGSGPAANLYCYGYDRPPQSTDPLGLYFSIWLPTPLPTDFLQVLVSKADCGEWSRSLVFTVVGDIHCKGDLKCCEDVCRHIPRIHSHLTFGQWDECRTDQICCLLPTPQLELPLDQEYQSRVTTVPYRCEAWWWTKWHGLVHMTQGVCYPD